MGFGWMFIGYTLLLRVNLDFLGFPFDITPDILGFLLMTHGFTVASKYCECFRLTRILGIVGIPASGMVLLLDALSALKVIALSEMTASVISYIYLFFLLGFTLSLLFSLYRIADQTGLDRLKKRAVRCAIYTVVLFWAENWLFDVLGFFGVDMAGSNVPAIVRIFLGALYIFLNAALIFSCYMWICLEGDEEMPDNRKHKYKTPFDYFEAAKGNNKANSGRKRTKHK